MKVTNLTLLIVGGQKMPLFNAVVAADLKGLCPLVADAAAADLPIVNEARKLMSLLRQR